MSSQLLENTGKGSKREDEFDAYTLEEPDDGSKENST